MEREDLLEKGFRLAHFLFRDRSTAIHVLTSAFDKLNAQHGYERKRTYWRDKYLKRRIYRITRSQADLLQWLIYFESEPYERQQERHGSQTEEDMVVRYTKFLVQTTTARSSFYVCVGLQRLLCRYSTAETQRCYEFISDRYLGTDEYRRAKSMLIDCIRARFGDFVRLTKTENGEVVFDSTDSDRWTELVRECLAIFTPWSTANNCLIPERFHRQSQGLPHLLSGLGHEKHDQDEIEINRCHSFIDPICHRRLTRALGLDAPEERLAVPKFFTSTTEEPGRSPEHGLPASTLTRKERSAIENKLDDDIRRRNRISPTALRILVDGNEALNLGLTLQKEAAFEIKEGARLIEVLTSDECGNFVVATRMIPLRHQLEGAPVTSVVQLRNSTLTFTFPPMKLGADGSAGAHVSVRFMPASRRSHLLLNRWVENPRLMVGLKYALVSTLCICLGWLASAVRHRSQVAFIQNQVADMSRMLARQKLDRDRSAVARNQPPAFQLISDELRSRSGKSLGVPVVNISSDQQVVRLILPVNAIATQYRAVLKPLLKNRSIISEDLAQTIQTSAGPAVVLYAPTSLLKNAEDYTVVLSMFESRGNLNEVDSFTFHFTESGD